MKPIYLFVTPFFPSPSSWRGGYCLDMVRALKRIAGDNYNVCVFVTGVDNDYEYEGIKVYHVQHKMLPCDLFSFLMEGSNRRRFNAALKRSGISWQDVAICHAHTFDLAYVTRAAKMANPNILTLLHHHCINPVRLTSWRLGQVPIHATAVYFYRRRLCEQVDIHVFCSEQSRLSYAKRYQDDIPEHGFEDIKNGLLLGGLFRSFTLKKSMVLYNGIDTSVFFPHGLKTNDGVFTIGCVGNFQPLKDQLTLLKAVVRLRSQYKMDDVRVVMVGSGVCLEPCKRYVRDNGLANVVVFRDEMPHLELPKFYRSLDLFVLPSRSEGFCCAYVEAAGCGVPIMGCRGVSIEEVIPNEDKAQWLITPCDYVELAEKIKAYREHHWSFRFNRSLDIDVLWKEFLSELSKWQTQRSQ